MEIDQPTETRILNLFGEGDTIPSPLASGNHKRLHVEREREEILPPRFRSPSTRWIRTGEGDWTLGSPYFPALSLISHSLLLGQEYKNQVSECSTQAPKRQRIDPSQFGDSGKILDERRGFMWMDGGLSSGNRPENAFLEHGETTIGRNNHNESSTSSKRVDDKVRNQTKKVPKKVTKEVEGENGASKRQNGNANNITFLISLDRSNILENASQEAFQHKFGCQSCRF
ncbi:hypothetical protein PVL29_013521 [Vitis rotundifolia]|uniref:Uncharacterized protein n=1 Tax=Vitis rotundifolia TaxID=103349 RepID=A0AA38ZN91_VITRO|nr:hypothetical protein PVL29_013521 [Vitis rotundifolia]